jgi:hypothetical protein
MAPVVHRGRTHHDTHLFWRCVSSPTRHTDHPRDLAMGCVLREMCVTILDLFLSTDRMASCHVDLNRGMGTEGGGWLGSLCFLFFKGFWGGNRERALGLGTGFCCELGDGGGMNFFFGSLTRTPICSPFSRLPAFPPPSSAFLRLPPPSSAFIRLPPPCSAFP